MPKVHGISYCPGPGTPFLIGLFLASLGNEITELVFLNSGEY
jgi:hypothetical protein